MFLGDTLKRLCRIFKKSAEPKINEYSSVKDPALRAELQYVDRNLERAGKFGRDFRAAFEATNCLEASINRKEIKVAAYYGHAKGAGFLNAILYNPAHPRTLEEFLQIRVHEATHALQFDRIAALHAVFENPHSPFIISPESMAHLTWLIEADATFKQGIMQVLTQAPVRVSEKQFDRVCQRIWQDMLINGYGLLKPDAQVLQDEYIAKTLHHYRVNIPVDQIKNKIPVRLGPEDFAQIANHFGPSPIKDPNGDIIPEFTRKMYLTIENQIRLEFVNAAWGLECEEDLPTLSQALAAKGMTQDQFLAMGKKFRSQVSAPQEPAPRNNA